MAKTETSETYQRPKNVLIENLRNSQGKNESFYECDASTVSYKTGIPQLDYYLGYRVNILDSGEAESYPSLGITGGSFVTFIGKSSTGKTTTAVQIASNIVRQFDAGTVMHFDLEQAMNYSRIQVLSKMKTDEMRDKYVLKQGNTSINDIKKSILGIYKEKISNPDLYKYETGLRNEFGEPIRIFVPTVVIIDSIATLTPGFNENDKKELTKAEEVSSQTERMRVTAEIGRLYTELMPLIRTANIIVIAINHIKTNPQLGFIPQPSEILYLKQDETLPGGKAPTFLAHILIKFVAIGSEKYEKDENGFDGFGVRLEIIKSRVNQAGQCVNLVYDKVRGIDILRSSVFFAKSLGLTGGNKNKFYFLSDPDKTFTLTNINEDFKNDRELYKIMYRNIIPQLETVLSQIETEEYDVIEEQYNYDY